MKTLIVPMAGKSTRFPQLRPKWMLTHPMTNRFMVTEAIQGLNLEFFDQIYFIALQDHENKYQFSKGLEQELKALNLSEKSNIFYLPEETDSQSETVYRCLKEKEIDGFIFIKDSDGYFEVKAKEENEVIFCDLNNMDEMNARSKSYIQMNNDGIITNIVEKQVIGPTFSSGGYAFRDAGEFCDTYEKLAGMKGECYVSHIVFEMILGGAVFFGSISENFKDWGTLEAWEKYKKQYKCLFVDIDGTLISNTSTHFPPYTGNGTPLVKNIELLKKLHAEGKARIILTTSRPDSSRDITTEEMNRHKIPYDDLIMGLPHCQRILVNDFSKSNAYPSCTAINIPRNSENLTEYLK